MVEPISYDAGDGSWACGKCGTFHAELAAGYGTDWDADPKQDALDCCTSCEKCGYRDLEGNAKGEDCCPCTCGDCALDEEAIDSIFEAARNNPNRKGFWDVDDPNNELGLRDDDDEDIFTRAWDTITKNDLRIIPPYLRDAVEDYMGGAEMPEVDVEPLRQDGDSCCEDLILAMLDLDKRYGTKSLLLGHDWITDGTEPCEEAVGFLDSAISYGKYLLEDGGGYMEYGVAEGTYTTEAEARHAHRMWVESDQGQLETKVLAEMREVKQQYEMCKGMANTGFEGAKEDESTGFYASAEPFELAWDSIMKQPTWQGR